MFPLGTKVLSRRAVNLQGIIVGYGVLQWPNDKRLGDAEPAPVYLVKVAIGSSALCQACLVFRQDQVAEVK